ncbi:MAG: hypothetical protein O6939_09490 [Bacteroidetes bacterium]|nr:hypothetical protein [Bacteroidota bacterium]
MVVIKMLTKTPRESPVIIPHTSTSIDKFDTLFGQLSAEQVVHDEAKLREEYFKEYINRLTNGEGYATPNLLNDLDMKESRGDHYFLVVIYRGFIETNQYEEVEKIEACLSARIYHDKTLIQNYILGDRKAVDFYEPYDRKVYTRDLRQDFKELYEENTHCVGVDRLTPIQSDNELAAFFEFCRQLFSGMITGKLPDYIFCAVWVEPRTRGSFDGKEEMPHKDKILTIGFRDMGYSWMNVGDIDIPLSVLKGRRKHIKDRMSYMRFLSNSILD